MINIRNTRLGIILAGILFSFNYAIAQDDGTEMFRPGNTERQFKKVNIQLPFHKEPKEVTLEFVDSMAVMEGDIIIGPAHLYSGDVVFAVVIDGDTYRWKDGIMPYTIQNMHPQTDDILRAIRHIHEQTSLRLIPRTDEEDYVRFVSVLNGCSSSVGRHGGGQRININDCRYGSIIHEILHAAGLWHEQSRSDRDDYITIHWDQIKEGKDGNFEQHIADGIDIGPYDCQSIMHYSAYAFSKSIFPTISSDHCESFGQRDGMSEGDIAAINKLYPPDLPSNLTKKIWHLIAQNSGQAVDISGSSNNPQANVLQNKFNKSASQKFRFIKAGGDYFYIQNVGSNMFLEVEGGNGVPGSNVWQNKKSGSDPQKWRLIDAGGEGFFYVRSKLGDINIEVESGLTDIGTNIQVSALKGGSPQKFLLREATHSPEAKGTYGKALEHYWKSERKDNMATASSVGKNNAVAGKYRFVRTDGYILNKSTSAEGQAVPLYLYYHDTRKDHFTAASPTSIKVARQGGYRRVTQEGYILKSVNPKYKHLYRPLWLYYNDERKDNFTTSTKLGIQAAEQGGYRKVRIEGYVRINNTTNLAPNTGPVLQIGR